jgi:hypothetical protein
MVMWVLLTVLVLEVQRRSNRSCDNLNEIFFGEKLVRKALLQVSFVTNCYLAKCMEES